MAGAVEFRANARGRAGCDLLFWFGGEPWNGFRTLTCCRGAIPMVSYGGTAMVSMMIAFGMLMAISTERPVTRAMR